MSEHKRKAYRPENATENTSSEKNKQKKGVSVPVIIAIVAVLIAIGIAAGYLIGHGMIGKPNSNNGIEVTSVESEPVVGTVEEVPTDVFTQELNGENDEALADLAGEVTNEDTISILQGDMILDVGMDVPEDDDTVVAEFKGGKIYRGEAAEEYNNLLAAYLFAGYTEEEVSEQLVHDAIESLIQERVLKTHAEEMGLTELNDADKQEVEKIANEEYADQIAYMMGYVREDNMTDEEALQAAAEALSEFDDVTYESIYEEVATGMWENKLYDVLTESVTVTEEEVRSAYDDAMAIQETSFSESREDFELSQWSGEVIVYNPEGYRAVKMINVYLDEDMQIMKAELDSMVAEPDENVDPEIIAQMQSDLDVAYGNCEAMAQKALDEMKGGASYETVFAKYSGDVDYMSPLLIKTGNYISADSSLYDAKVIEAAMALKNPGDYSGLIRTDEGVCVMQLVGDVPAGPVAYEVVHDDMAQQTLDNAKEAAYIEKCNEWLEEVSPVYYEDRMY